MSTIARIASCFLFGTFLSLATFAQTGEVGAAPAPPPPMSELPDIANGEVYVLAVDDILVAQSYSLGGIYPNCRLQLGLTSNSAISQLFFPGLTSNELVLNALFVIAPELVAAARLYNSETDVGLTFTLSDWAGRLPVPLHLETSLLTKSTTSALSESLTQTIPMAALQPRAVVVADFNGDGLDDVVFHAGSPEADGSRTIIGTAADVSDPTSGLRFGPEYVGGPACLDMKAGDLDGDGVPELICLLHYGQALWVVVHTVDPTTLQILDPPGNGYHYMVASWNAGNTAHLAVGKFDDDMGDNEIVVVHGGSTCPSSPTAYCSVYVTPFKVSITPPPPTSTGEVSFFQATTVDIGPYLNGSTGSGWKRLVGLEVATGKLNWFGGNPRSQIVVAAGMNSDSHYKGYAAVVVNFVDDATLSMSISPDQVKASAYNNAAASTTCLNDVAVGRFSPPSPNASGTPTNSQVALLLGGLSSGDSQATDCGPSGCEPLTPAGDGFAASAWDATGLEP